MEIAISEHVPILTMKHLLAMALVDPSTLARNSCLEPDLKDPAAVRQRYALYKDDYGADVFEMVGLPQSNWREMAPTTITEVQGKGAFLKPGETTQLQRAKFRVPTVSALRVLDIGELSYRVGTAKIKEDIGTVICCSAILEDQNGRRIRTIPIMAENLVQQLSTVRTPRLELDALFVCVPLHGYPVALILDADVEKSSFLPIYSQPTQRNLELDIELNYAGKEVTVENVRAELEDRFNAPISYHMALRAINAIAEKWERADGKKKLFHIPSVDDHPSQEAIKDETQQKLIESKKNRTSSSK